MELLWATKTFDELSNAEIYQILSLRNDVFVVEQNCIYQDVDNKDQKALHILGSIDTVLVAYCRVFKSGDYFDQASIGRVVVNRDFRNKNYGDQLIKLAITTIDKLYKEKKITISAQFYLQKFYQNHGFVTTSEVYLEDDIEHIQMKIQ